MQFPGVTASYDGGLTRSSSPSLQYRMVFAVACVDKLLIYDTQQAPPIGFVSDIHYSSITDLAWYVG